MSGKPRNLLITALALGVASVTVAGFVTSGREGQLEVLHAPARVTRKVMPLTANVMVRLEGTGSLRQRVNGGPWTPVDASPPRVQHGVVPVEVDPAHLVEDADNVVELEAGGRTETVRFRYDSAPPSLPLRIDWAEVGTSGLEVQDGAWEVVAVDGEARVRPVPGTEGYDRILLLSGAFRGGRRVTCDVVLREPVEKGQLWGFGPLPYWAGHPEPEAVRPRRGWCFALSWFYSKYGAFGLEFSRRLGDGPMEWVAAYHSASLQRHEPWRCVVEAYAERREDGELIRNRMRTKWWPVGEAEPDEWLELADRGKARLVEDEFAVAFVVHRCQVEIGPVRIEAVPDVVVD